MTMVSLDYWKLFAALVAGAILPLSFAPFEFFWLAPFCYAALFRVWGGASPAHAFRFGFTFGVASFFSGVHWVYISIHDYGEVPIFLSFILTAGLVVFLACYVGLVGWIAARWFSTIGPWALLGIFPALWVFLEWCRGWFFSGFGWLSAGYSQTDSWLMGHAPVIGLYGISWIVLVSAGAMLVLIDATSRQRIQTLTFIMILWGSGLISGNYRWTNPRENDLSVALVQGAVNQDLKWRPEQLAPTLDLYQKLTERAGGSELIIWPEAAIPALYGQVTDYLEEIRGKAARQKATVMLGILRNDPEGGTFQNTLVALTDPPLFYVKRHLVPFGEYFPVPEFVRNWMRLTSLPYTDAVAGSDNQPPLEIAGERIAITICYEDIFGAEQLRFFDNASLLVNVSNDAWFGDSIAPHQHLQIARFRAAEVGRYLLRATNTGVSAIIDPRGRVVARSPQFVPDVLKGSVRGFLGFTPYARWGNYPVILGVLFTLLLHFVPTTKFTMRS